MVLVLVLELELGLVLVLVLSLMDYEEHLLALRSTCWQPGIATNLAIWHSHQSGGRPAKVSLAMMTVWSNLALTPIWPIWQSSQSGNLATGAIWLILTKLIAIWIQRGRK